MIGKRFPYTALTVLILLSVSGVAAAGTFLVLPDGSGDVPTIAAALHMSTSGDVIELGDGVYHGPGNENLILNGQAITLRSRSGNPAACIIDPEADDGAPSRAMVFSAGETALTLIEGIGFRGGYQAGETEADGGGALLCENSSPRFVNCRFWGNEAYLGGAVHCDAASPSFEDCVFVDNIARWSGGALSCTNGAAPTLVGCSFRDNLADTGGGIMVLGASIDLNACLFTGNQGSTRGGALYGGYHAELVLTACTLAWNRSPMGGGLTLVFQGNATLDNCIVAHSLEGEGIGLPWPGPVVSLSCSDIYGNAGGDWLGDLAEQLGQGGNIGVDPRFCGDADDGDVNLRSDSPCLAAQSGCGDMGALLVGCSSRRTDGESWSRVKSFY